MRRQASAAQNDLEHMLSHENERPRALPLSLLENITDDFSENHRIGSGGFAVVYKGKLENGVVAVKKLSEMLDISDDKFKDEIRCLMKVKHKNIVRFLGYCANIQGEMVGYNGDFVMADVRQRLLCFEYLPKGNLDEYMKGRITRRATSVSNFNVYINVYLVLAADKCSDTCGVATTMRRKSPFYLVLQN